MSPAELHEDAAPSSRAAVFTLSAVAVFVGAVVSAHWARPELAPMATPLSVYLHGPGGLTLRLAYLTLAAALVVQAVACRARMPPARRTAAPLVLFGLAAAGLLVAGFARMHPPGGAPTLQGWLHGTGAMAAFLCTTTGALLQVLRQRGVWPRSLWHCAAAAALAAFGALWVHVLARDWPRGLTQKTVVALVLLWLLATAAGLRGRPR